MAMAVMGSACPCEKWSDRGVLGTKKFVKNEAEDPCLVPLLVVIVTTELLLVMVAPAVVLKMREKQSSKAVRFGSR